MNIKKHIPNFLTCCNLLCGCLGLVFAFNAVTVTDLIMSSYLIFAACVFDFLDGFVARLLKVTSPIGKELDSLADVVTFGVLPGVIIFQMMGNINLIDPQISGWPADIILMEYYKEGLFKEFGKLISLIALLIPVFSALRLAKFNIDTRQSESFIGVPTPANGILIASLPLILTYSNNSVSSAIILNPYFLISLTLIMSYLLVAELPLFALKFKNFTWADNKIRFSFMGLSVILFIFLTWIAIPIIIFLYIILSFIENKFLKTKNQLS